MDYHEPSLQKIPVTSNAIFIQAQTKLKTVSPSFSSSINHQRIITIFQTIVQTSKCHILTIIDNSVLVSQRLTNAKLNPSPQMQRHC